jgi:ABC-2 type transporter
MLHCYTAHNRFGLHFFMLLYLALLTTAALPPWIAALKLYLHEAPTTPYTPAAFLIANACTDLVAYRVFPALALALSTPAQAGLRFSRNFSAVCTTVGTLALFAAAAGGGSVCCALLTRGESPAAAAVCLAVLFGALFGGWLVPADELVNNGCCNALYSNFS